MLPQPKRVRKRSRTAHHEAGHAVLSAALNDAPLLVSIKETSTSMGRARYRRDAPPQRLVQVDLAGFAAEEVLCGRRSRQLNGPELGFSLVGLLDEQAASAVLRIVEGCDQHLAVQEILATGCERTKEAVYTEFERYYQISKDAVTAVWPAVQAVAVALSKAGELDSGGFFAAVGGHDIYGPVFAVQQTHGLAQRRSG